MPADVNLMSARCQANLDEHDHRECPRMAAPLGYVKVCDPKGLNVCKSIVMAQGTINEAHLRQRHLGSAKEAVSPTPPQASSTDRERKRFAAAELLRQPSPPSLRAIARTVGLSVTTVSDIRTRLTHDAEVPTQPDAATNLRRLTNDPALRHQHEGRALLHWLHQHAITAETSATIEGKIPPHCADTIASLARAWATTWLNLARNLDGTRTDHDPSRHHRPS
jgi:hypothetical protein